MLICTISANVSCWNSYSSAITTNIEWAGLPLMSRDQEPVKNKQPHVVDDASQWSR